MHNKPHTEEAKKKMSQALKGRTAWNKGKKLPQISGKNHYNWKNGKFISRGYIYILNKNHPFAEKRGYVLEAHLVMEKKLGRYLLPKEVVHHIDGDKLNNSIKNLVLFATQSVHIKLHKLKDKESDIGISNRTFKKNSC